jgi:hypothetical protein
VKIFLVFLYIHATALLMEGEIRRVIPFREHQHAFAAIHYTMLIAAEILIEFANPVTV